LDQFIKTNTTDWEKSSRQQKTQRHLIAEEPLSIRVQGKPYAVIMRTPGDEIAHVAGFSLAEGIVDSPDDISAIAFCDGDDTNVVTITLKKSRLEKISQVLDRREFISQTSCGLCGKEIVKDLYQAIRPLPFRESLDKSNALECLEKLSQYQPLRQMTKAAHAAVIYSSDFKLLSAAEDVGRHNALDKAVGRLFLDRKLAGISLLTLSSRISYELVQKAARARIPVILALSRPTSLAVELADKLNMALACQGDENGLTIFCGEHHFNG